MNRPRLTFLAVIAAATIASGCTTFSDNDAVARVDDEELTTDLLQELVTALDRGDPSNAAVSREAMTLWVQVEAISARLDAEGITITEEELDEATTQMSSVVPGFSELSDGTRDYLVGAQASFLAFTEVPPPDDDEIREFYERGPLGSGLTCVAHILVDTEQEAREILDELEAGADFAELAAERSIDEGSALNGGAFPCSSPEEFAATYVPPFVDAALTAEVGVPTGPVRTEFGYHVIIVRPIEELQSELAGFFQSQDYALIRSIEAADIHIDPRYGTLERTIVVPLS